LWPAINFFMWKWPVVLKRLGRPVLGVPVYAHSVVTLLANSRGWSSFCVVFSLTSVLLDWIYCIGNFFTFSWKTEFAVKFFTVLNIFFTIQDFWTTCDCPEKQRCLKFFTVLSILLHSEVLSNFPSPWKTACALKIFTVLNIFFIVQDFWATYACPENRVCPEFTVLNIHFLSFRIIEHLALALKNSCLEIFHCIEIFLLFRIFHQRALALKTDFALKFFKTGGAAAPPNPAPRTPMAAIKFNKER